MRPEVEGLLRQAEEDAITAQGLIEARRWYASVFFSHQVAEKSLKALYIIDKAELPATHDLVKLCRGLAAPETVLAGARRLNRHYTTTRYPDAANGVPADQYDEAQAREYQGIAQVIVAWVNSKIA